MLIDTMPLHARAWQDAVRPLGLRVARRAIYEWEGESGVVTAKTLLGRREADPSHRAIAALLQRKERRFAQLARRIHVNREMASLLETLAQRGLRLGLVTGTSFRELMRIVPRPVLDRFAVIVTGDAVRRGKPHSEPYRRALRALSVKPRQAIVIENAPYGIRSARAAHAGLIIALASSLPGRFLHEADRVVRSSRQLRRLLEGLTAPRAGQ